MNFVVTGAEIIFKNTSDAHFAGTILKIRIKTLSKQVKKNCKQGTLYAVFVNQTVPLCQNPHTSILCQQTLEKKC